MRKQPMLQQVTRPREPAALPDNPHHAKPKQDLRTEPILTSSSMTVWCRKKLEHDPRVRLWSQNKFDCRGRNYFLKSVSRLA
jgi:hypothetical protein